MKTYPWKDEEVSKPPLGVMPKYLHREKRITELTRALNDCANYNIKDNKKLMLVWAEELVELLKEGE